MNFAVDDDVMELVESISDFFDRRGDAGQIAEATAKGGGIDRTRWTALCQMGLPVLRLPEPDGIGANLLAATAVAERIGAVLLPEPAVATMVLAEALAARPETAELLESLSTGARLTTMSGLGIVDFDTSGGLSGQVRVAATKGIDSVALLAGDEHTSGTALVIVDADAFGAPLGRSNLDPTRPTVVVDLAGAEPTEVLRLADGAAERIRREFALLTAAELVGGMQRVLEETKAFVTTRQQFGRPVGSFQSIKHKLADMYALTEQARALVQFAALDCTVGSDTAASITGSLVRWVPRSAISVCEEAIHLHGAMGYSWEVDIHLHLRRALATRIALEDFDARSIDRLLLDAEEVA